MSDVISRQLLDLWNRYKPTIAVDAIEYDRELKKLLGTNLASLGTDTISRQAAIDAIDEIESEIADGLGFEYEKWRKFFCDLPPAHEEQEHPEIIRCKDCKHFEYNHVENVNGIPLIVAHEICMRWGDGAKTSENGYCFLAERREVTDGNHN